MPKIEIGFEWSKVIEDCLSRNAIFFTRHAKREMEKEEFGLILTSEVFEAMNHNQILEVYPDDNPYPRALILGTTSQGRPIHFVGAYDQESRQLIIVTVYQPDPARWIAYKELREQ
ncbi:MAG: DUF4258 domain-containing protein [Calditrichota bacterium]